MAALIAAPVIMGESLVVVLVATPTCEDVEFPDAVQMGERFSAMGEGHISSKDVGSVGKALSERNRPCFNNFSINLMKRNS